MSFITDLLARIRSGAFTQKRPTVHRITTPRTVGAPTLRTPRGTAKQRRRQVNRDNRARKAHTCGTGKGRVKLFY